MLISSQGLSPALVSGPSPFWELFSVTMNGTSTWVVPQHEWYSRLNAKLQQCSHQGEVELISLPQNFKSEQHEYSKKVMWKKFIYQTKQINKRNQPKIYDPINLSLLKLLCIVQKTTILKVLTMPLFFTASVEKLWDRLESWGNWNS